MPKINVLIAGSTGYIGIQLIKILVKHKYVKIKYLCGNTSVGKKVSYYDTELKNFNLPKIIKYNNKLLKDIDVVFTALPNGEAQKISKFLNKNITLIDLAADFRIKNIHTYRKWYKISHKSKKNINKSIYSLPEIYREKIKNYQILACPGCYPTSVLIPLIPLIQNKIVKSTNIIIDSKSGYSGAGRGVHIKHKKNNLYESLSAYGVFNHRHSAEIQQEIDSISNKKVNFVFTPHLSPMFRGILSTIYIDLNKNINANQVTKYLKKYYEKEYFIKFAKPNTPISTNDVINTNFCKISINKGVYKNKIIILSAIDNLIKGGAGQAVQNLNLKFNFPKNHALI